MNWDRITNRSELIVFGVLGVFTGKTHSDFACTAGKHLQSAALELNNTIKVLVMQHIKEPPHYRAVRRTVPVLSGCSHYISPQLNVELDVIFNYWHISCSQNVWASQSVQKTTTLIFSCPDVLFLWGRDGQHLQAEGGLGEQEADQLCEGERDITRRRDLPRKQGE